LYSRPLIQDGYGGLVRDFTAATQCPRCVDAAGGSATVTEVLCAIQDSLCDRCPGCKGSCTISHFLHFAAILDA
jgi:hypothetical protein